MGKLGELLTHPDELVPMASMFMAARRAKQLPQEPGLAFCYDMLNRVSRSFAIVIQQLPHGLRDAVCVFYLVLRALDTVEDDMGLDPKVKVPLLRCFHEKSYDRSWKMSCGSGEYVRLMENYPLVTDVFQGLDKRYQQVIADICKKMGAGMADFVTADAADVEDYNLYCHYVAGLVGIGLSHLFASSGGYGDQPAPAALHLLDSQAWPVAGIPSPNAFPRPMLRLRARRARVPAAAGRAGHGRAGGGSAARRSAAPGLPRPA
ncbi:hypothetical protein CHLNCDRAFT_18492 [Chlorella variabilis]|uniref:Uncharacterized protein SQS n=1 Tax=Chlorella variabilis TaxID=554065 RepID=E1Z1W6_CHLVA|nr:hypothetical protein CHLNCDRAFT_18492 [Chlorella variabilis]EFN59888.1 hypothetical protein CHLNCDRAFT_18492 [Chlorella variabilis]|eukprot:XP_005851990.1 hypothetical protein CHLNCDRAFT_18492 [Chlorella variabilis]